MTNLTNLMSTTDLMPPGQTEEKSTLEKVLIIIILLFIIVTAVVGNLFVCIAVVIERSLWRGMYFLIASLAVADLLCAVLSMPVALYIALYGRWVFGAFYCRIWIFSDVALCLASILHLCPIALDRYMLICHKKHHAGAMTCRRTVVLIAGIWAWSLLVTYVWVCLGWQKQDNEGSDSQQCDAIFNPVYTIVNTIISFYVPCIALLVIYSKLFVYVFLQQRKMRLHAGSLRLNRSTAIAPKSMASHKASFPVRRMSIFNRLGIDSCLPFKRTELKLVKSLTIIAGSFVVCWVPFFSVLLVNAVNGTYISPLTFQVLTWLGYSNSCLNPVVYAGFTKPFHRAFRRMFCPSTALQPADQLHTYGTVTHAIQS